MPSFDPDIFASVPAAIAVAHDRDATSISVNRHLAALLGLDFGTNAPLSAASDEAGGSHVYRSGRRLTRDELPLQVAARTNAAVSGWEAEVERHDGTRVTIAGEAVPLRHPDGTVRGSIGVFRDISARKHAEAERLRAEARFRDIANSMSDAFIAVGRDWTLTFVNERFAEVTGHTRADMMGRVVWDLFPEAMRGHIYETARRAMRNMAPLVVEDYYAPLDLWFESRLYPTPDGLTAFMTNITERKRTYEQLQQANRLKDEFLATLSHELRTPLTAILGYARMLRSGMVEPEKQHHAIAILERTATSLTQIVNDVLDVSRIISGKIRLNVKPVDLPAVVSDAVATVLPAADAKGVRVETVFAPDTAPISGDPDRLQQVVWNLLSNAVKFTPRGGRVAVRVEPLPSGLELVVSDTGIGVAPGFLPYIFERFRQANSGPTREYTGLGLGLAIVRHIVELHGGTVQAASDGEGRGATFHVRFPAGSSPDAPVPEERRVHARAAQPPTEAMPDLSGTRVLTIDDDLDALMMVREVLEFAGADVSTATSAAEALEQLAACPADVVLADLGMPHVDGFALLAEIRRSPDERVRSVPAAALTAYARAEDRTKVLRSGFQMHLGKPIDPGELVAAVAALAKRP